MKIEELEDLAYHRLPMPEETRSQADILAYLSFRSLYDFAARVQMAPEQGKREKAQIVEAHKINKFLEDLQEDTQQMWKRIELAAADYARDPSVDTGDKLYEAIYQVKRKGKFVLDGVGT